MSSCFVEAKRDYFGSSACISTTPTSAKLSSVGSPPSLQASQFDLSDRQQSPFDNSNDNHTLEIYHSPANGARFAQHNKRMPPSSARAKLANLLPIEVDAVYEQPMAKALQPLISRQARPLAKMGTFKGAPDLVGLKQHQHQLRRVNRPRNEHNSLESLQSKLSSSSATNELPEDDHQQRSLHKGLVTLAVKPVDPPEVPHTIARGDNPTVDSRAKVSNEWHTVTLNDDGTSLSKDEQKPSSELSSVKRGFASSLIAKLRRARSSAVKQQHQRQIYQLNAANQLRGAPTSTGNNNLRLSVDASNGNQDSSVKKSFVPLSPLSAADKQLASKSIISDSSSWASIGQKQSSKRKSSNGDDDKADDKAEKGNGVPPKQQPQQIGKREAPFLFAGIFGSILGSVFFSMAVLTIKLLPDSEGLAEKTKIVCWRGATMMVLCSIGILRDKQGTFLVPRDEILINVLRSIFGFMGIYMSYISLKYISMGDATALVFSSPVWTSLLSHYILHEPLQWIQLLALPLSLLGIILIAHPSLLINMEHKAGPLERQPVLAVSDVVGQLYRNGPTINGSLYERSATTLDVTNTTTAVLATDLNQDLDIAMNASERFDYEHRWKGIVIALACSFVVSLVYIVLKFRKHTPIQTATFWLAVTNLAGSFAIGAFVGLGEFPNKISEVALLLFNGVCSWLGQSLLQWALGYEDASVLSVVRTLDVAMSFTLSAIFLNEEILWTSILGAAIIAAVVISIMLSNYIQNRLWPPSQTTGLDSPLSITTKSSLSPQNDYQHDKSNKTPEITIQYKQAKQMFSRESGGPHSPLDSYRSSTKNATLGA